MTTIRALPFAFSSAASPPASCSSPAAAATSRRTRARCGWSTRPTSSGRSTSTRIVGSAEPRRRPVHRRRLRRPRTRATTTFSMRGGVAGATIATLDGDPEEGRPDRRSSPTPTPARRRWPRSTRRRTSPTRARRSCASSTPRRATAAAIDAYLDRQRRLVLDLAAPRRRRSRPRVSACRRPSSTSIRAGATAYRLCVTAAGDKTDVRLDTTLVVGDREIITVILSRTPAPCC